MNLLSSRKSWLTAPVVALIGAVSRFAHKNDRSA